MNERFTAKIEWILKRKTRNTPDAVCSISETISTTTITSLIDVYGFVFLHYLNFFEEEEH